MVTRRQPAPSTNSTGGGGTGTLNVIPTDICRPSQSRPYLPQGLSGHQSRGRYALHPRVERDRQVGVLVGPGSESGPPSPDVSLRGRSRGAPVSTGSLLRGTK